MPLAIGLDGLSSVKVEVDVRASSACPGTKSIFVECNMCENIRAEALIAGVVSTGAVERRFGFPIDS
jgi:hypothetical protein